MKRYVWIATVVIAVNLVAFAARGEASLSDIQSGMLDEVISARIDEISSPIRPDLSLVTIPIVTREFVQKHVGDGFEAPRSDWGYEDAIYNYNYRKPDYVLIFIGKLSGYSAFSPYARFATNDYWQVVYPK